MTYVLAERRQAQAKVVCPVLSQSRVACVINQLETRVGRVGVGGLS